ncbi:Rap1a/Tai family immunity protein [Pseudomonas zhanjiangensis]|uniref:Rap1a/Tai family immunity protein n=1 Tax=Pseudomonas zhanjiangensis TaxID=3239015 RepID=A0ABV3YQH9_9PSED
MKDHKCRLVATLVATLLLPPAALAGASRTAGELAGQCQLTTNLAVIVCHIYLHAVQDVLVQDRVNGFRACLPADADIDRSVRLFVDWVAAHPPAQQAPASDVIAQALAEAYPCD